MFGLFPEIFFFDHSEYSGYTKKACLVCHGHLAFCGQLTKWGVESDASGIHYQTV
ncbi:MAG: hypothetical protein LBQ50_12010 [Planctomycetaceae bacterium]|nr:hypothetical protein [Planctomycetaceae bacterium]